MTKNSVESMRRLRAKRRLADLLQRHIKLANKILEELKDLNNDHPDGCRCGACSKKEPRQ